MMMYQVKEGWNEDIGYYEYWVTKDDSTKIISTFTYKKDADSFVRAINNYKKDSATYNIQDKELQITLPEGTFDKIDKIKLLSSGEYIEIDKQFCLDEMELEKEYLDLVNDTYWKELKEKIDKQQVNYETELETLIIKHKFLFEENKALKELLKVYLDK
jgi:hypothetical protein